MGHHAVTVMKRQFASETEFEQWHEQAKEELDLPRVGVTGTATKAGLQIFIGDITSFGIG